MKNRTTSREIQPQPIKKFHRVQNQGLIENTLN